MILNVLLGNFCMLNIYESILYNVVEDFGNSRISDLNVFFSRKNDLWHTWWMTRVPPPATKGQFFLALTFLMD